MSKLTCRGCDLLWECIINYHHDPDMDPWDEGCDAQGPEVFDDDDEEDS